MTNNEMFVRTIVQGQNLNESPEEFKNRILKAASDVVVSNEIDQDSDSLAGGVDISIPVDISQPIVTDEIIVDARKRHAAEVEAIRKSNQLLINGLAAAILAAGTTIIGGAGATSFISLVPVVQQLLQGYLKKG